MAKEGRRIYPYGRQTFSDVRENSLVYVDKTEYVYELVHGGPPYLFLNRPRGFGKTLLLTTLCSYFEGRRELFKGLAIERLEKEWKPYPVIFLQMGGGRCDNEERLRGLLEVQLMDNAREFGIDDFGEDGRWGLETLIRLVREKTGKQVVVLVDDYDKALVDFRVAQEVRDRMKRILWNFYIPLKSCGEHLQFVLMTGLTRLSLMDIFGGLNNLKNIAMHWKYVGICGITREELEGQLGEDVETLAEKIGETREETVEMMSEYYGGYRFGWPSPEVFNPYGVLHAFMRGEITPYSITGYAPKYIVDAFREKGISLPDLCDMECMSDDINAPAERPGDALPLIYQGGYVSIKSYDDRLRFYTLDIPNKETRDILVRSLWDNYVEEPYYVESMVMRMERLIYDGAMEEALQDMRAVMAELIYREDARTERHYQQLIGLTFMAMGGPLQTEVRTPRGWVYAMVKTRTRLYEMEVKMNKEAEAPLKWDMRGYGERFSGCCLPRVKVRIDFDSDNHTIGNWQTGEA